MDTTLWILQIVLAVGFLAAGGMKLTQPRKKLEPQMGFVTDFSDAQVKLIGLAEVAGAIGLVLPAAIDLAPVLTPVAASGLVLLMFGAAATHLRRHEPPFVVVNAVLLILAAVVAWGRFGPYSF